MSTDQLLEDKILTEIKRQGAGPIPRWHFLLKDYVVWAVGAVSLLAGALAFSVFIYLFINNDWEIYREVSGSFLEFFLLTLPYFWILFLALFVIVVDYNVKHTKHGYRYPVLLVVLASIVSSMLLGAAFFKAGFGRALDRILGDTAPFYADIINPRLGFWSRPEDGRLAGVIISQIDEKDYILFDRRQHEWQLNFSLFSSSTEPMLEIMIGRPIRALGHLDEQRIFIVKKVLPLGPGPEMFCPHCDDDGGGMVPAPMMGN